MTDEQQEILNLAIDLIKTTPEQTGKINIEIEHGRLRFIQVTPSLRFNMHEQTTGWLKRALTLFPR